MIEYKRITIRTILNVNDFHFLHKCHCDKKVVSWNLSRHIYSFDEFFDLTNSQIRKEIIYCIITYQHGDQDEPIGFVYSYNTRQFDGTTYICLYLIKEFQGKGLGVTIGFLTLNYLFKTYAFRKIYAEVLSCNPLSLNMLVKCGFTAEGNLKEYWYYDSTYWDLNVLSISRSTFQEASLKYNRFKIFNT